MFRFFENLVDPFCDYTQTDSPPRRLLPFLLTYARPFRGVFGATVLLKVLVASFEIGLIWYMGRLVDILSQDQPQEVIRIYGGEFALAAFVILVVRTVVSGIDVALLHNTIMPNFATLIRWRAHRRRYRDWSLRLLLQYLRQHGAGT